jgi:Zn-finger nucleic acid-binding protein
MKCPKCKTTSLVLTTAKTIEVDQCPSCKGIWFDERELSDLLELSAADLRRLKSGKEDELLNRMKGQCPRDNHDLVRVCSSGNASVVIDLCTQCRGIWLDGGELSKLTSP